MNPLSNLNSYELNRRLSCELAGQCSGCPWIEQIYGEQLLSKKSSFLEGLEALGLQVAEAEIVPVALGGFRSRLDLTLQTYKGKTRLGLYSSQAREIIDMRSCPLALPELNDFLAQLREVGLPKVQKGSLRLRVGPEGQKGLWIDFANVDVRDLLQEDIWLEKISEFCTIEMGQRFKRLIRKPTGEWGLGDLELAPWFQTYVGPELLPQHLYLPLGGFSQTSWLATQRMISALLNRMSLGAGNEVLELFSGNGNFTLPLLFAGKNVVSVEMSPWAGEAIQRSFAEAQEKLPSGYGTLELFRKNLYKSDPELWWKSTWVVDPPRSGLGRLIENLESGTTKLPSEIFYISCFQTSLLQDTQRLMHLGYRPLWIYGVDQFPHTPHCEWIVQFSQ
ncbi:MAG: class I SAM-dependent RNA methyltransferase [Bdellovibrionales bacterium]|nr:class I SAM-dependent RNA methyltransferase [Bdellovibrionales bacterium]